MDENQEKLNHLRHSCAHLLAAAVMELWPDTNRAIGPAIENGFYYDFDFRKPISEADLPLIEKKMAELLPSWTSFSREEVTPDQARQKVGNNPYKLELIDDFSKDSKQLTFYKSGGFEDLCKGGHSESPAQEIGAFKLQSIAGAYWRGSEKNKMLTRIYGTCFNTKEELDKHLEMLEEAKKRDHKKLGPQLELFMFHETSPGMPYWLPNGVILYNELINFWRIEHAKRGYQEIVSPLLNKKELYITSGHWQHYLLNMFTSQTAEGEIYGVKAMNCPNAMIVFDSKIRSYRDFPLRFSDTDTLHRYEPSGTLNGLLRVREFRQDDAHIFVTENQIKEEYQRIFELVDRFYSIFGMEYSFRLGTRPEDFMGDVASWDKAEAALEDILKSSGKTYFVLDGDGAFYGPKVDILMKDALGRSWQMGTIQLDFQQPKNFNLKYIDEHGKQQTPVVIHRVIYGSLERFIGILIEHFAGSFPTWLAPIQATIVPISDKFSTYAQNVLEQLYTTGVRVEIDNRAETMQAKIRDAQMKKVPFVLVVGGREAENNTVAVRGRNSKDLGVQSIGLFLELIKKEIELKSV